MKFSPLLWLRRLSLALLFAAPLEATSLMDGSGVFLFFVVLAAAWSMAGPKVFDWHADFRWSLRRAHGLAAVLGARIAIILGGRDSTFLYFRF